MAHSTPEARNTSVQRLLKEGFRVQFSNVDMTVLSKPTSHSTMLVAQVTVDGHVNTEPLDEFLCKILECQ